MFNEVSPEKMGNQEINFSEFNGSTEVSEKSEENLDIKSLETRNEDLEGKEHEITGVPFERKTVTDVHGNPVEGVFPNFESRYTTELSPEHYLSSDSVQFHECNQNLYDYAEDNLAEATQIFDDDQLDQIREGERPEGYTWHHTEETGVMQLVDSDIHRQTAHTGGRFVWGGGTEMR
ncbi:HNH endonuclease [Ligilactobacillus equi]|uniref:HNH endonuclease n=1 Tax=Ligilactobacillus equi DSM 15833 = JCM 10991 TaxID=1423740 RepID=A0A0R1TX60_9LACO|nr:HNH endonuclease [Ligilactobacillus equi]KRL83170.1 hypothetical protein FC36_GL000737 [Ligilactobacillus equi DSM 15833 = JCM 10991]